MKSCTKIKPKCTTSVFRALGVTTQSLNLKKSKRYYNSGNLSTSVRVSLKVKFRVRFGV